MPFTYHRTIRFSDTDAAGVVYFATVLSICHEAYEASLAASGVNLKEFFRGQPIAVPLVHAEIDFLQPMFCGESYAIQLQPTLLGEHKFAVSYAILTPTSQDAEQGSGKGVAQAKTIHLCIDSTTRHRQPLPANLTQWLSNWS